MLKSKNPDDLQEANKLIKSMVKEVSGKPGGGGAVTPEQRPRALSPALPWEEEDGSFWGSKSRGG